MRRDLLKSIKYRLIIKKTSLIIGPASEVRKKGVAAQQWVSCTPH